MSNWILKAAEDYLTPVYEQLHKELLKRNVLHADETTLQVLHEPGKAPQSNSYMWLYRTSGDTEKSIVLYEYQPGRGGKHPKEFLDGFRGYLHTDGYAGYHSLPGGITVAGCWTHARRKFDEAMSYLSPALRRNVTAEAIAEFMGEYERVRPPVGDMGGDTLGLIYKKKEYVYAARLITIEHGPEGIDNISEL